MTEQQCMARLCDRFSWARKRAEKTQEDIGAVCGLTKGAISAIENDRNGIAGENVFPIADALGVNARRLITGDGSPDSKAEDAVVPEKIDRIARHLSVLPDEKLNAIAVMLGIKF